ncbi:MAG: hypothetical protein MRY79_01535 [Alphaproteobacteria bacterium]|nr:hypothetical protein [Alphaproteobacteria bacterium]
MLEVFVNESSGEYLMTIKLTGIGEEAVTSPLQRAFFEAGTRPMAEMDAAQRIEEVSGDFAAGETFLYRTRIGDNTLCFKVGVCAVPDSFIRGRFYPTERIDVEQVERGSALYSEISEGSSNIIKLDTNITGIVWRNIGKRIGRSPETALRYLKNSKPEEKLVKLPKSLERNML